MSQSKWSYIDTDTLPVSYVNSASANLAAVTTQQQIDDLETQLSDVPTGLVARVIHISGNYVKVKWFKNNKPVGMYKARGHTLGQATGALEYYKTTALATPTSPVASMLVVTDDSTVAVGGTAQLTATATLDDASEVVVTDKTYYTSSPTGHLTIDSDGVVTGVEGDVKATSTLTSNTSAVTAGKVIVIGNKTYTLRGTLSTGPTVANEVLAGANAAATLTNLKAAINGAAGVGTTYSTGTTAHTQVDAGTLTAATLVVTAKVGGTQGNSIATTTDETTLSWTDTVLSGGTTKAVTVTGAYGGESDDVTITVG